MSENSGLNISSDTIYSLYKEAGKEIPYSEATFNYDSDILVGGQKKTMIQDSIDRLGIAHQPAQFQVNKGSHKKAYFFQTLSNRGWGVQPESKSFEVFLFSPSLAFFWTINGGEGGGVDHVPKVFRHFLPEY